MGITFSDRCAEGGLIAEIPYLKPVFFKQLRQYLFGFKLLVSKFRCPEEFVSQGIYLFFSLFQNLDGVSLPKTVNEYQMFLRTPLNFCDRICTGFDGTLLMEEGWKRTRDQQIFLTIVSINEDHCVCQQSRSLFISF